MFKKYFTENMKKIGKEDESRVQRKREVYSKR